MQRLWGGLPKSKIFGPPWPEPLHCNFSEAKMTNFGHRGRDGLTMVNQCEIDPSHLSHFTLPAERAKSTEKFRVSPLCEKFRTISAEICAAGPKILAKNRALLARFLPIPARRRPAWSRRGSGF